ncbi:TIGR03808 family TAT-translocated repetitive protein [Rhizobium sp. 18065]|uniref:TIGR03808 family TAT-translocated repetitive protein n=1 Tax=Rhizobium sp. 18065 TaxID=2681411 RepID=UPI001359C25B|nr:TIGR03808 family TAT-translocated repetitive protein [Rhizobium sp. 18065]
MPTRRSILSGLGGLVVTGATGGFSAVCSGLAAAQSLSHVELRGGFDAADAGIMPGADDDQSRKLQALINAAAKAGQPVFLPAGTYEVSNLDLPEGTRLSGVPGATRLSYRGDGHLVAARDVRHVSLSGITFDGANRWIADYTEGLLAFRGVEEVLIDNCAIAGSRKYGVQLERCGGRIAASRITGAAKAAIWSVEGRAMTIRDNEISDCGNGGILVHRWTKGIDNTMVTGNRIARIAAADGGTGQHGNGINLFRADGVMIEGNHVTDCAFSAIRANSASNVIISGNQVLRSGETAIYAEFSFEGALIAGNLVDGAANGISVVNFDQGGRLATVSGNIVRNVTAEGPYVHDGAGFGYGIAVEAETSVTGNVVENAAKAGLMLGWGPYLRNVVVSDNIIRKAPVGVMISIVEGTGSVVVSHNLIAETPTGAILGYRWADKATQELIDGSQDPDTLIVEGNRRG